jgi:hypothetical protein
VAYFIQKYSGIIVVRGGQAFFKTKKGGWKERERVMIDHDADMGI